MVFRFPAGSGSDRRVIYLTDISNNLSYGFVHATLSVENVKAQKIYIYIYICTKYFHMHILTPAHFDSSQTPLSNRLYLNFYHSFTAHVISHVSFRLKGPCSPVS